MDESKYQLLADATFRRIDDGFRDTDPDVVECERSGDVLTLTMPGRVRCVVNTQRVTRQVWVAAKAQAWHFNYEEATGRWLSDKTPSVELFETLRRIVRENASVDISF
jgi:CyaY protein